MEWQPTVSKEPEGETCPEQRVTAACIHVPRVWNSAKLIQLAPRCATPPHTSTPTERHRVSRAAWRRRAAAAAIATAANHSVRVGGTQKCHLATKVGRAGGQGNATSERRTRPAYIQLISKWMRPEGIKDNRHIEKNYIHNYIHYIQILKRPKLRVYNGT